MEAYIQKHQGRRVARWRTPPSFELYHLMIKEEAERLKVRPSQVMAGVESGRVQQDGVGYFITLARWRVFARLAGMGYSYVAIGKTAGFTGSAVKAAVDRLEHKERKLFAMIDANLAHFGLDKKEGDS